MIRRGFTLIEVIAALVLTAVVTAVAGAALGAARSAEARVLQTARTTDQETRVRSMLTDMLRHAPDAALVDEPLLRLDVEERSGAVARTEAPTSVVRFLSQGVQEPFGTGPIWRVTVAVIDGALVVEATPVATASLEPTVRAALPDVSALTARVFEGGQRAESVAWRPDWPMAQDRPALLELQWTQRGAPGIPLRVELAPLVTRP